MLKLVFYIFKLGLKILALVVALVIFPNLFYLCNEFVIKIHGSNQNHPENTREIPKHIHQLYFDVGTPSSIIEKFKASQKTCINVHETYNYTFWNKSMVDSLIKDHYPSLKDMYDRYGHWVTRVDAAKYLILHEMGGFYIDMDIICKKSVEGMRQKMVVMQKGVVVRSILGFNTDFIGASRRHTFFADMIHALPNANRWFILPHFTIMFSAGPAFFTGRYLNYEKQEEFWKIGNDELREYINPITTGTWNGADSGLMWRIEARPKYYLTILVTVLFVLLFCLCCLWSHTCSSKGRVRKSGPHTYDGTNKIFIQ